MNTASQRFLYSPFPAPEGWPNDNNDLSLKIGSSYSAPEAPPGLSTVSFANPSIGIILVVLLVAIFLMGLFSVYVARFALISRNGEPSDDQSGRAAVQRQDRGLDRAAIDTLPIVTYDSAKRAAGKGECEQQHEWQWRPDCVVCLADFQDKDPLRLLPTCEHCFHPECIDMWLFSHSTCPLCRRSLLPPPQHVKGSSTVIMQDEARSDLELETVIHGTHNLPSTGHSLLVRLDIATPPPPPPLPVASDDLDNQHHAMPFAP